MGYRANIIKQHREYGSQAFSNYTAFCEYLRDIQDRYEGRDDLLDCLYESESGDFFELPKDLIKLEIDRLSKLDQESIDPIFNEEVKWIVLGLQSCLDEAPEHDDYVALEWF